jgi:hypothetical protein
VQSPAGFAGGFVRRAAIAIDMALLAAIVWLLASLLRYARQAPPSFDGGMNLNTARSFMEGHGYGFVYDVFFPFPAQTDGPFVLPSALLMLLHGVVPLSGQGVNLAYFVGATILVFVLLRLIVRSRTLALGGTLIVLQTPGAFAFGMNGYGEVPSLFWFLAAVALFADALDRNIATPPRLAAAGAMLALCYLTKVVALLLAAPAVVLFAIQFVAASPAGTRGRIVWFFGGLAAPIIGWESFRLAELGGWPAYAEWWQLQMGQVRWQSGAAETLAASVAPLTKGAAHLRILADLVGVPVVLMVTWLLLPWFATVALVVFSWRRQRPGTAFALAVCGAVSVLYFVWWLFITPTEMTWLRRIVDGLLLQQMLWAVVVAFLLRIAWQGARFGSPGRALAAVLVVVLLLPEMLLVDRAAAFMHPPMPTDFERDQLGLAQQLRDLPPDAMLFGLGWWQSPVLALFSGRTIMNLDRWDPTDIDALAHKYLVMDYVARYLVEKTVLDDILAAGTFHVVTDRPGGVLYRIDKVLPYAPFTASDRDPKRLASGFDVKASQLGATRGLYPPDGAAAWAKPNAALLLARTDQTRLSLSIIVPDGLVPGTAAEPLRLHVSSPDCLDAVVPLVQTGPRTVTLPLTCAPTDGATPMEIWLHANGHLPFVRQIDAMPHARAYVIVSAQLQ